MGDRECWFAPLLEDTLTLMRATVMMEKPYYKVGGSIGRYPKFVPEDYVILPAKIPFRKVNGYSGCRECLRIAARTAEGRRNIQ